MSKSIKCPVPKPKESPISCPTPRPKETQNVVYF